MKIAIVGSPSCRKSTTAEALNIQLKQEGYNSAVCPEIARTYIGRYGPIKYPWEQFLIYLDQVRLENELTAVHDIVICDSASWLGYIYTTILIGDSKDIKLQKLRQELHTLAVKSINSYDLTFFMPVQKTIVNDGIRIETDEDRRIIQDKIWGFMNVEEIPFITVTGSVQEKTKAIHKTIMASEVMPLLRPDNSILIQDQGGLN